MTRVGLISCVSRKRAHAAKARDLYDSALFTKTRQYVEQHCDKWYVLSAKHGLVFPDQVIEPYEDTLNTKSRREREDWTGRVWEQISSQLHSDDCVVILAGARYREFLVPLIESRGCRVEIPMEGKSIGRQLQWLSRQLDRTNREADVSRLYDCLGRLEEGLRGKRLLSDCSGRQQWPLAGIYVFFEPGERRTDGSELRVVRVGTHRVSRGSKATLWNRLRTHRGTSDGSGNHRSSIFRLHVGAALAARQPSLSVPSWGLGQTGDVDTRQAEEALEKAVSKHIGAMSILWLPIEDESSAASDRAYLERNLIGLLVGRSGPSDAPSHDWLGRWSPEEGIKISGLWNLDFLDYPSSSDFIEVLSEYVLIAIGKRPKPSASIAPHDWYTAERQGVPRNQMSLFGE